MRLTAEQRALVLEHLDVAEYARKQAFLISGWLKRLPREDLIQESHLALCVAVAKCDFSHSNWKQFLMIAVIRHMIRLPQRTAFFCKIPPSCFANKKRRPRLAQIGERIEHMGQVKLQPKHCQYQADPCEGLIIQELRRALDKLVPAEADMIRRKYGLDGPAENLVDMAEECGVTRATVSVWHRKTLRQLKESLE